MVITRLILSLTQGGVCLAGEVPGPKSFLVEQWDIELSEDLQNWEKCDLMERARILEFITCHVGDHIEKLVKGVHTVNELSPDKAVGMYTMGQ